MPAICVDMSAKSVHFSASSAETDRDCSQVLIVDEDTTIHVAYREATYPWEFDSVIFQIDET